MNDNSPNPVAAEQAFSLALYWAFGPQFIEPPFQDIFAIADQRPVHRPALTRKKIPGQLLHDDRRTRRPKL